MRTVCVVVTARPSYARVKTVLEELLIRGDVRLEVIVAGSALLQRYGRVVDVMRRDFPTLELTEIHTTLDGDHHEVMVQSAAHLASHMTTAFRFLKPDIVVTVADRYETLGTALAASYMNIPLAHIQGGELTGSIDDKVRHAITQLADIHFPATENAESRIHDMRLSMATNVYRVGCPSIDLAQRACENTQPLDLYEKYGGLGPKIHTDEPYYVLLQHPVTTHAETARAEIVASLAALQTSYLPVFVFWPNIDTGTDAISKALREYYEQMRPSKWHFFRHIAAEDFLRLLLGAWALVGNSSVGIRECSYLGVPVVDIGDRQCARDTAANVIHADPEPASIHRALDAHFQRPRPERSLLYGDGTAGRQISQYLAKVDV